MILDHWLGVNFYIPISLVNENFSTASSKNSQVEGKFWTRWYFSFDLHGELCLKDEYV